MTPQQYERVSALFDEATSLDSPSRAAFLARIRSAEPELAPALEDLLARDVDLSRGLFESRRLADAPWVGDPTPGRPAVSFGAADPEADAPHTHTRRGSRTARDPTFGNAARYELRGILGRGGMGAVYLVFDNDLRREVALKVVGDADSALAPGLVEEAQVVGQLAHPNIVPVHDIGVLADGRPYYTMSVVRGHTLASLLKDLAAGDEPSLREWNIQRRIAVLIDTCRALSHAHARGVLHRDIKPSNIMIGAHGEVLVMDWGLAKVLAGTGNATNAVSLDPVTSGRHEATVAGTIVGTPAYMSPEQADGLPMDERTDVYLLGALLYELLTLSRPFDGTMAELLEAVRSRMPDPPESRMRGSHAHRSLSRLAMKALAKRPEERPASVEDFLAELTAWRARVERRSERLGRIRAAFLTSAVAFALIAASGAAFMLRLDAARRQERETRLEATRAAATSQKLVDFLVGLFKVNEPGESRGSTITAREVLDRGSARIGRELADEPVIRASLEDVMGRVYSNLDLNDSADHLLVDSLALRRTALGDLHPDTMDTMARLASVRDAMGRREEALELMTRRVDAARTAPAAGVLVKALCDLSRLQGGQQHPAESEAAAREAVEVATTRLAADDPLALTARASLAAALYRRERIAEALPIFRDVFERRRAILGDDHPDTIAAEHSLANSTLVGGDVTGAERLYADVHERAVRVLGETDPLAERSQENVALCYSDQERHAEAIALRQQILESRRRIYGPEHDRTIGALVELTQAHRVAGDMEEAEKLLSEAIALRISTRGPDHPATLAARDLMVEMLRQAGKPRESVVLGRAVLADRARVFGPESLETALSKKRIAEALMAQDARTPQEDAEMRAMIEDAVRISGGKDYWQHAIHGRVCMALGDAPGAVQSFRMAVDMSPPGAAQHAEFANDLAQAEAAVRARAANR